MMTRHAITIVGVSLLMLLAACSDPEVPHEDYSWDAYAEKTITAKNLKSAILRASLDERRESNFAKAVDGALALYESQAFVDRWSKIEEIGFLDYCSRRDEPSELDSLPSELPFEDWLESVSRILAPSELTYRDVVEIGSRVKSIMTELENTEMRACYSYKEWLSNRLFNVVATLPVQDEKQNPRSWTPAEFAITNNSGEPLSVFLISWAIRVQGRQTAIASGHFMVDVVGGLEPGETVTRSFGLASKKTVWGFSQADLDKIREAADIFGQDQLLIKACVGTSRLLPNETCFDLESAFDNDFRDLSQRAANIQSVLEKYLGSQPKTT